MKNPSPVLTAIREMILQGRLAPGERVPEADLAAILQRQCLAEPLLADEIARMALFLAADDSRMITKQSLIVDAGMR